MQTWQILLVLGLINAVLLPAIFFVVRSFLRDPSPVSSDPFGSPRVARVDPASALSVTESNRVGDLGGGPVLAAGSGTVDVDGKDHPDSSHPAGLRPRRFDHEFPGLFSFDTGAFDETGAASINRFDAVPNGSSEVAIGELNPVPPAAHSAAAGLALVKSTAAGER